MAHTLKNPSSFFNIGAMTNSTAPIAAHGVRGYSTSPFTKLLYKTSKEMRKGKMERNIYSGKNKGNSFVVLKWCKCTNTE